MTRVITSVTDTDSSVCPHGLSIRVLVFECDVFEDCDFTSMTS